MNNSDPNHPQQQQYEIYGYTTHSPARLTAQPAEITTLTSFPLHTNAGGNNDYSQNSYDHLYRYQPATYYHHATAAGVQGC